MKVLRAVFRIKKNEFAAYRSNIYLNFVFGCVPLIFSILFWKAVYGANKEIIGGYSYKQMITYYVNVFLMSLIINSRDNTVKMAEMIQNGNMHNFLLKPIGFISLNFKLYIAEKIIYLLNIFIPFILFCLLIRKYIFINVYVMPVVMLSACMAFILKYLIGCIFGLMTVWIEEISGLLDLWNNIENFFSGGLLPLSILPALIYKLISILPFKFLLFVPIDIYMGKHQNNELIFILMVQGGWIVIFTMILLFIRKKAYRFYSGYGT